MARYKVLFLSRGLSPLGQHVVQFFRADRVGDVGQASDQIGQQPYRVVVIELAEGEMLDIDACQTLLRHNGMKKVPLVILSPQYNLQDKLRAFEIGCDDFIDSNLSGEEVCARITKSIFHRIANDQLSQRLELAAETARSAVAGNSDLDANIRFLLAVHDCDNLDQLGQQFFATTEHYQLSCSLQMRSTMGIKDMEAHGMAKDLESQLLFQLQDSGQFVEFGPRTIVNFKRVSLLIKNTPTADMDKRTAIKQHMFCLVQGIDARIAALEDHHKLLVEKDSLRKLSNDVQAVIGGLQASYQTVMRDILAEVESVTEVIQNRLPHLALNEQDEKFIDEVTAQLVRETNRVFGEGLKVDEVFARLERAVQRSLESVSQ